jgi:hypothetical protein
MSRRALRRARVLRGVLVAACGAVLAISGHLLAGGSMPVHPALLLLIALAAGACTLLSDREWSFQRLLVALTAIEAGVHVAMTLDQGSMRSMGSAASAGTTASDAHAAGANGWVMLAAHVAAALLTAWGLRQGEALFWRLVERLRPRPLWPTLQAPLDLLASTPAAIDVPRPWQGLLLEDSASRRGPPALTAA